MAKSAILDQLKTQVGLGGTNRARDEQIIETLTQPTATSRDYINAYNNAIHPRLENQRKGSLGLTATWGPDEWDKHIQAGGLDYRVPIPKIVLPGTSSGTVKPAAAAKAPAVMHFDKDGNLLP